MDTNLLTIFLTGLLTGGLTCMAVQGGLLAATLAQREEERLRQKVKQTGNALPILAFLIAKLTAYTILGFFLGWFGSLFKLSITTQVILQVAIAIFMLGTALNILNVHPIFRYFVIQPPKFLTRMVRKQSKSGDLFAPGILGAFTIFIPCGTTQAMMALAIASGNPLLGAAILFAFILGTSPLFFVLGYFATKLGDKLHKSFMRFAAFGIIILAVFNLNNSIALSGSNYTLDTFWKGVACAFTACISPDDNTLAETTKNPEIQITSYGYNPTYLSIKAGEEITLRIVNNDGRGCQQAFTVPALGIQKIIPVGGTETFTFTAPSEPGQISFMCSMGMYRGVINVI